MARYRIEALEQWVARVFGACGVPGADASAIARLMIRSDARGYDTHGLTRVASYVQRFNERDFNPRPAIRIEERPGVLVVDADGALGHAASPAIIRAGRDALERAPQVFVAVRALGHLGALGIHALAAAEAGLFCVLGQRTPPTLGLEGFNRPGIGHNPIAFGCPRAKADPIVFDIACSVAARGHILLAAREGRPIPAGWAVDRDGKPTTDSRAAADGMLLPMGGHKGIGVAMLVEILAGAFAATADSVAQLSEHLPAAGAVGRQSAFFWFMRPGMLGGPAAFDAHMARWIEYYEASGGRMPGTRGAALEAEARARGIVVPADIERELATVGAKLGLPFETAGAPG